MPFKVPSPEELVAEPELAALAVLNTALEVAYRAVATAHPGYERCKSSSHPHSERCGQAQMLRIMTSELQADLETYLCPEDRDEA